MPWHWHSWEVWHENNNGISNAQYCLHCVLCSWILIILMTMRLRRKEEKKVELGSLVTCQRGWSVPDLDIGTWIFWSQRSGPRGNCHEGREQDITRREQSEQDTPDSPLRWKQHSVALRHWTGWDVRPGALTNNDTMPGITVAIVSSRVTPFSRTR